MSWLVETSIWYIYIFFIGIICLPVTFVIFGSSFKDRGYAFSKTIGILLLSYSMYVIGRLHFAQFSKTTLYGILFLLFLINTAICIRKKTFSNIAFSTILIAISSEIIFFTSLIAWVYIRGQEPSIRGLEKFMDFGFINSILRSNYFPPHDMWFAGSPINYYYFGHLTGAVLTKLTQLPAKNTYNIILATIFALSVTQAFSLCFSIVYNLSKKYLTSYIAGFLGSFFVNIQGNLHTIYAFTKGYNSDNPVPFWKILSTYTPQLYWYPNATRFIPYTIHEFPIYSYVVADLHGHVFDIPFVLLSLAIIFSLFIRFKTPNQHSQKISFGKISLFSLIGAMIAIHYMTNAFDGPIYLFVVAAVIYTLFGISIESIIYGIAVFVFFIITSLPFSLHFKPFASGIGINCAPLFLTDIQKIGPFLFEKGNCQQSPIWMLLLLWGFFTFHFVFFIYYIYKKKSFGSKIYQFIFLLFTIGHILIIIPEFMYMKDIYPAHFRANTMFKLGYQAFIMMSIASCATFFIYAVDKRINLYLKILYISVFIPLFFLTAIYPTFAIRSYYGDLKKTPQLDGIAWAYSTFPEYAEIISYLNNHALNTDVILEAQGDSYSDYNIVSSYTGLQTVVGWFVHEWLWRGGSHIPASRTPDVEKLYKSESVYEINRIIKKYSIDYIIVGPNETAKYGLLNEETIKKVARKIFVSSNNKAKLYYIPPK